MKISKKSPNKNTYTHSHRILQPKKPFKHRHIPHERCPILQKTLLFSNVIVLLSHKFIPSSLPIEMSN